MQKKYTTSVRIFYPRLKEELLKILKEGIDQMSKYIPIKRALVFGSLAKGTYKVSSDIDLLIIYDSNYKGDVFKEVKKKFSGLFVEPHVYSEEEYYRLKEKIENMTKESIILI